MASKSFFNGTATTSSAQITSTQTTITGQSTATWPPTGDYVVRIDGVAPGTSTAIFEDVLVTANAQSTGIITVTRGQDSTVGQAFAANATLTPIVSAKMINDAFARIDQTSAQAFSGPITIPPSAGVAVPSTLYGSMPIKLAETAGDGATNAITFSAIPTNFRTLIVEVFGRATNAATSNALQVQLNGDATGVYDWTRFNGAGAAGTWGSVQGNADTSMTLGYVNGSTAPANAFCYARIVIAFANSTTFDKSLSGTGTVATSYAANNVNVVQSTGIWHNATPAAVTSIKLITGAGFWATTALAILSGSP